MAPPLPQLWGVLLCSLLICLLPATEGLSYHEEAPDTLRQVHVLMRHGKRAPIYNYPGDPNNSEENWPYGYGELTKEGLQMHDRLGRWFRKRYDGLLDRYPNPSQIHVVSTDVDRVINSAQANLAALFFLSNKTQRYNEHLPYTPVPVHTLPAATDRLLHVNRASCRVVEYVSPTTEWPMVKRMMERAKNGSLFSVLSEKLGEAVEDVWDLERVYDTFKVQEEADLPLAPWARPLMPLLKEVAEFVFELLASTALLKKFKGGPLLQKIVDDSLAKARGDAVTPNFLMYSAHDATIAINMQALGVYNHQWPPYAAAMLYELHQLEDGEHYLKVLYHNDSTMATGPHQLTLPGCEEECHLTKFQDLLKDVLIGGSDQDYGCNDLAWYLPEFYAMIGTMCSHVLVLLLAALIIFCIWVYKKRPCSARSTESQPLLPA